mmetsp:Transcript_44096/g.127515  ORF Transcript_44096/g.127515 Transcript_44096/m.127515 type:complete len:667 (-) Transcript_44096:118-2118(-)
MQTWRACCLGARHGLGGGAAVARASPRGASPSPLLPLLRLKASRPALAYERLRGLTTRGAAARSEAVQKTALLREIRKKRTPLEQAVDHVAELRRIGKLGAAKEYTSVIKACDKGDKWQLALSLLNEMYEEGLEPAAETVAVVSGACERAGQPMDMPKAPVEPATSPGKIQYSRGALLQRLRRRRAEPSELAGTVATLVEEGHLDKTEVYTLALRMCESGEQWEWAIRLLDMCREGPGLEVETCNVGIAACAKAQQWQRALTVLDNMQRWAVPPDVASYHAAASACSRSGEWQAAIAVLDRAQLAGLADSETYSIGMMACASAEAWSTAVGMLSAIEVSLTLPNRPWAWAILWVCMVFLVPPVAVTMHFSLDHFCTPAELIYVIKRSSTQKMEFTKQSVAIFAAVLFVTVVQVGSVGLDTDWYGRLIILGMWCAFVLLAVLITFLIRRFVADEDPVTDIASDAELATRQRSWRPVRVGVYLLWWFMGFNTCLNGILYPNKHTLSHGIMQWHGKGAMLYYLYFCGGLLYFKLVSWHPLKFMRLAFYTVVMIGCGLAGGNYFVNGSYKANAEVRSYGIPCENDGAGDDSFCTQAYNSTLDGDYPCGYRDGRYICLVGSLDYNMACATGSLDGHSLWHVFSAIALFVLPLSVMVIDDLVEKPRHLIAVL